jgi:hypothetical protein
VVGISLKPKFKSCGHEEDWPHPHKPWRGPEVLGPGPGFTPRSVAEIVGTLPAQKGFKKLQGSHCSRDFQTLPPSCLN